MFRFRQASIFWLLVSCHTKLGNSTWSVVSGAVCAPDGGSLVLRAANIATLTDSKGTIVAPKMQLVFGSTVTNVVATYDESSHTFAIPLPANSATGYYDVIITRASDGAKETVKSALQILGAPVITAINGQAACTSATSQTFTISGSNFGSQTSVTLAGDPAPLPSTSDASGSVLTVTAPTAGHTSQASYVITVSNGGTTCVAASSAANGFAVKAPPTATGVIAGPHLKSGKLAHNAAITVRVTGTSLSAGSVVTVGGVPSTSVVAVDGTTVDASFAAGALAASDAQAVTVANGPCVSPAAPTKLNVASGDMSLSRISPNGWVAGQQGVFFDTYGSLSAAAGTAAAAPHLWIDTDTSPFTEQWQQVNQFVQLDAAGNAVRFANVSGPSLSTATSMSGATNVSVTSADGVHEAFLDSGITLTAAPAPRLVWKDRDFVMTQGDSFTVYGCHLDGASFKLVSASGDTLTDVSNGELSFASGDPHAADDWGASKFKCSNGNAAKSGTDYGDSAAQMVTLTTKSSLLKGVYRIRSVVPAGVGAAEIATDDLYPLVVYDDAALVLSSFSVATGKTLASSRKAASATIASDATGRAYAYVIGGGGVSTMDPGESGSVTGGGTYEFSALDPDHNLIGFLSKLDLTNELPSPGNKIDKSYGMAVVSDGTRIYAIGGTSDSTSTGNETSAALQATVIDPTSSSAPMGSLSDFTGSKNACVGACAIVNYAAFYGAKAALAHIGSDRFLVVFGGFNADVETTSKSYYVTKLSDTSGITADLVSNATNATETQAPAALLWSPVSYDGAGSLLSPLGLIDNASNKEMHDLQSIVTTDVAGAFTLATPVASNVAGLPNISDPDANCAGGHCFYESGFGTVFVGSHLFLLGGTNRSGPSWVTQSTPRVESFVEALSGGSVAASAPLARRLSQSTVVFAAPNVYVVSGAACKHEDNSASCETGGEFSLTPQIEESVLH